jgi:outer membrane protein TolC
VVNRLHAGSRPEEIAQARANVLSAKADSDNARRQYDRLVELARSSSGRAVSRQDLDSARAALEVAEAKLAVSRKALDLQVAGPRKEDIAQAETQLKADEASSPEKSSRRKRPHLRWQSPIRSGSGPTSPSRTSGPSAKGSVPP